MLQLEQTQNCDCYLLVVVECCLIWVFCLFFLLLFFGVIVGVLNVVSRTHYLLLLMDVGFFLM